MFKSDQLSIIVQYERLLQYYTAVWIHLNEHISSSVTTQIYTTRHKRNIVSWCHKL